MAIRLTCRCGTKLKIPANRGGTTGRCPRCGAELEVPAPGKRKKPPPPPKDAPAGAAAAAPAGPGIKGQLRHLWATRRSLMVILLVGTVCIFGAGVVVVATWRSNAHRAAKVKADQEARRKALAANENARRAKLQQARQLAGEMRFADALREAEAAAALASKATSMNQELWSETYDLVKELTWKKKAASVLESWFRDMSKGNPTSDYWARGVTPSTLFSVRSWKLLQLTGAEMGPITVRVRVDSSTKGGMRITKDWGVVLRFGGSRDYAVAGLVSE